MNCELTKVESDTLSNLKELKVLNLSSNKLSTLDELVFDNLTKLKVLSLAYNKKLISLSVKSELFKNLLNLRELNLSHTGIHTLKPDMFKSLLSLRDL